MSLRNALTVLVTVLLLQCYSASAFALRQNHQLEHEFIQAMEYEVPSSRATEAADRALQQALLQASTRVRRKLQNDDATDDAADSSSSSIDLTRYALKYIGCSNIHTWNDEAAAAGASSPFSMDRFVILRLCEASSCSSYNKWGCNYNYGEYMLPMETYLEVMYQHHVTQFGYYCRICSRCMTYKSNVQSSYNDDDNSNGDDWSGYSDYWGTQQANDAAGDDGANQGDDSGDDYYADDVSIDDDAYGYNQRNRKAANNNDDGGSPFYINSNGTCSYESVCSSYKSACSNAPSRSTIQQYFQCQKFSIGNNGNVGYLGPHCRSDGRSIDIGFYEDQYCNQFLGETQNTNIKSYLSIDSSDMDIYTSKTCIPCQASSSFALLTDSQVESDTGQSVYSLCSALYEPTAKCQRAFVNREDSYQVSDARKMCCCSALWPQSQARRDRCKTGAHQDMYILTSCIRGYSPNDFNFFSCSHLSSLTTKRMFVE